MGKEKGIFYNLEKDYKYLSNYMNVGTWGLFNRPHTAVTKEKLYVDNLILEIAKIEDKYSRELLRMSQSERTASLKAEGIIPDDIYRYFKEVRLIGSKEYEANSEEELEAAFRIYRYVYKITGWFIQKYINEDYELKAYKIPMPEDCGKPCSINKELLLRVVKKVEEDSDPTEGEKIKEELEQKRRNSMDEDFVNLAIESIFEDF